MNVGDIMKVLPPFNETDSDEYVIASVQVTDDGQTVYYLGGAFGAFSADYLEVK